MILATKPFEAERPLRSWAAIASTFVAYAACLAVVLWVPWLALRIAAAVLAGLVQFRIFALFHEHNHGALLAGSRPVRWLMSAVGVFLLSPRAVWKETHDFHHWNNGKLEWTSIGSYPVLTAAQLEEAEPAVRRVAVGWLDGVEFVPIAHAAEIVRDRATGQLARWTPRGFEQVSAA